MVITIYYLLENIYHSYYRSEGLSNTFPHIYTSNTFFHIIALLGVELGKGLTLCWASVGCPADRVGPTAFELALAFSFRPPHAIMRAGPAKV